jgi:hypothetical protein
MYLHFLQPAPFIPTGVGAMNELSEAELNLLTRGLCPKCGSRGFVLGPQDGASITLPTKKHGGSPVKSSSS